jgi:hypothetical protein
MSKLVDNDMKKYGLIKGENKKCVMCDNKSEYIEYCSEGHFCSTECLDEFYKKVSENENINEGVEL